MQRKTVQTILSLPRLQKRLLALTVDTLLCVGTVLFAYYLRLGVWVWPVGTQWLSVAAACLFAIPLFISSGFYRAIFRYAGWSALMAVARAAFIYGAGLTSSGEMEVIGFIDNDRTLQGSVLNGKTVYPANDFKALSTKLGVTDILLALPSASRKLSDHSSMRS